MKGIEEKIKLPIIGSTVKVNLDSIDEKLSNGLEKKLIIDSMAKILDYKITDGTDIGFLLELSDGSKVWFFNYEVSCLGIEINHQTSTHKKNQLIKNKIFVGGKINYVINPINFFKWLIYVSSDVF